MTKLTKSETLIITTITLGVMISIGYRQYTEHKFKHLMDIYEFNES